MVKKESVLSELTNVVPITATPASIERPVDPVVHLMGVELRGHWTLHTLYLTLKSVILAPELVDFLLLFLRDFHYLIEVFELVQSILKEIRYESLITS